MAWDCVNISSAQSKYTCSLLGESTSENELAFIGLMNLCMWWSLLARPK